MKSEGDRVGERLHENHPAAGAKVVLIAPSQELAEVQMVQDGPTADEIKATLDWFVHASQ